MSAKGTAKKPPTTAARTRKKKEHLPELSLVRAAAALCRKEFKFFVQEFWEYVIAEPMVWEPHMDVLCFECEIALRRLFMRYSPRDRYGEREMIGRLPKEYDLVINVPPGSTKSTIISQMLPVWGWINDPTLRYITGSYSGRVAVGMSVKSRDIMRSPKFQLYFPEIQAKEDEDGKSDYKTTALGQRFSTSPTGSATSQHAHCIIIDDPLNPKQAASPDMIEKANEWHDHTLATRKVDKEITLTIVVMQRLAVHDMSGHLTSKKGKKVRHVCLPAELSKHVKPKEYRAIYTADGLLAPKRMSRSILEQEKINLGSMQYAAQYGQTPIPLGGGVWKRWFIEVPDEVFPAVHNLQKFGTDWDLAYTTKQENSASAYVSAGTLNGRIYIDDIGWDWLEFPELIKWMKSKPKPHYIEAKASGKSAKQTLTRAKVTAIEVVVKGGEDKMARANMSTPIAESGIVYVRKSIVERLYSDTRQGLLLFPKAEQTDLADVIAQCLQRLGGDSAIKEGVPDEETLLDDNDDNLYDPWAERKYDPLNF